MKTVEGTVNNTKVKLVAVEVGHKATDAKRDLGLTWDDDYTIIRFGSDVEDAADFEQVHPGDAALLKAAGIDINGLSAVIEIRL